MKAGRTAKRLVVFGLFMILAGLGAWALNPERVVQVGYEEPFLVETPHPVLPALKDELTWSEVIEWPGASYIAVHFAKFKLAAGERVVIETPDGAFSYTFTGRGKKGSHGNFWATHVPGDTCLIRYYSNGEEPGWGFAIDKFAHGFSNEEAAAYPEALCGTDDSGWAKCYQTSEATIYTKSKAVARLLIGGSSACTGWLVGSEGHLITNNHCIASQTDANDVDFEFMAEGATCTTSCASWFGCPGTVAASSATLIKTDTPLDYALVKLPTNVSSTYGYLQLRQSGAVVNERIYIPQHPAGYGKKIAVNSTDSSDGSGKCEVYSLSQPACQTGGPNDVGYYADTQGGSSGSPVLGYSDHLVVSLHHCGTCPNRGVPIQNVITHIGTSLPTNALPGGTTTYSISGSTKTSSGTAISGVTVTAGTKSASSDTSGNYTITGLANGTYTVTPSKSGYTFSPTSLSVTIASANVTGKNFTGTAAGDTVLTSGVAKTGSVAYQAYAHYDIAVPSGATQLQVTLTGLSADVDLYTGSPTLGNPTTASYTGRSWNSGTTSETLTHSSPAAGTWNIAAYGYAAGSFTVTATVTTGTATYSISGSTKTSSGTAISGVTVTAGSLSAASDTSGNYTITGLANGTYTVTPSKSGYTFSPTSLSVTISGANQTGKNFTGTATGGPTTLFTNGFEATTGWAQADTSGTAGTWSHVTSGTYPTCSKHGGSYMAKFNSYNAASGSATRYYRTSGFATTGYTTVTLTFWMYHDTGYTTSADKVQPQVSTNGTTWTAVGSAVNRYDGSTGWKQHTVNISTYAGQSALRVAFLATSAYGNNIYLDDVTVTAQ